MVAQNPSKLAQKSVSVAIIARTMLNTIRLFRSRRYDLARLGEKGTLGVESPSGEVGVLSDRTHHLHKVDCVEWLSRGQSVRHEREIVRGNADHCKERPHGNQILPFPVPINRVSARIPYVPLWARGIPQ